MTSPRSGVKCSRSQLYVVSPAPKHDGAEWIRLASPTRIDQLRSLVGMPCGRAVPGTNPAYRGSLPLPVYFHKRVAQLPI